MKRTFLELEDEIEHVLRSPIHDGEGLINERPISNSMELGTYSADVYNRLPDLPDAVADMESKPGAIHELRDLIRRFGLEDTVGVAALHKHFPVQDDEQIVEEMGDGASVIQPEKRPVSENPSPYLWKLDGPAEDGGHVWRPLEFVRGSPKVRRAQQRLSSTTFLEAAAEILNEYGLKDSIGLTVHHRADMAEAGPSTGEVRLLEITDEENRTIRVQPTDLDSVSISQERMPQTVWSFASDSCRQRLHEQACYDHRS